MISQGILCLLLVLLAINSVLSEDLMTKEEKQEYSKCKEAHKKAKDFSKCDEELMEALTMFTMESPADRKKNKCSELKVPFDCLRKFSECHPYITVAYDSDCNSTLLIVSLVVGILSILILVCCCSFCVYKCCFGTRVIEEGSFVVLTPPEAVRTRGVPNRTELMTRCGPRIEADPKDSQKFTHT